MATVTPFKRDIFILKNPASVYDDYAFKGSLGDGGSGQVLRAVHKRTGITRAVKRIAKKSTNYRQFEAEVRALISLDHPHILKVIEYFEDANYFYVVTEICLGQDVFDYMSDRMRESGQPGLTEREAGMIIRQALKAVNGCHSKGIIHRDLKLENFMFMGVDHTIKLIDFGFAKRCGKDDFHTEVVGTKEYMAPEMFKGRVYDTAVDIWSLGVMLFAMLTGEFLLPAGQDRKRLQDPSFIASRLASCRRIQELNPDTRDFLTHMLQVDPSARPTAAQALKHPFIQRNWHGSVNSSLFQYKFDRELPEKMKRFAEAPLLRKIGLLCVVHLVGASVLPAEVRDELLAARHNFRSLNKSGTGVVTEEDIRQRLAAEGIAIPEDFSRTVARCSFGLGDQGEDGQVGYTPMVAALLMDSLAIKWPQCFFREAFNIMDRSRNGVIEVSDLIALTGGNDTRSYHVVFREVDTDGIGYINYDKFMSIVGAGSCANRLQQQQLGVLQQSTQVQAPTRPSAEAKALARPSRPAGLPLAQALAAVVGA